MEQKIRKGHTGMHDTHVGDGPMEDASPNVPGIGQWKGVKWDVIKGASDYSKKPKDGPTGGLVAPGDPGPNKRSRNTKY